MRKIKIIVFCMLLVTMLSACSVRPHIVKNTKVEKVAKECINPDVHVVSSEHIKENSGAGAYIWYQFKDERGIDFRVGIDNRYISFVEPIKSFYSRHYSYITDYKDKIVEYYEEDISKLLDNDKVKNYSFNAGIVIEFEPDTELSEIAEIIMKINDMVAFDYYYNCVSDGFIASDISARWSDYCPGDILVKAYDDSTGDRKNLIYSFIFSDCNSTNLTYDKLMMCLSADRFSKENSESNAKPIGMFMIDDVLYYETGEVSNTVFEEDCTETTKRRVTGIPHNNEESNIGASMPYTKVDDNELVIFYQNEGHIYHVFEYWNVKFRGDTCEKVVLCK